MLRFTSNSTTDMNVGNLRIALLNYIASKQKNEDFMVRIEDINKDKNLDGKDQETLDILALFGIEYSQVIYQKESLRFHTAMALQLMHDKKAFNCFCSDDWLEKKRQEAKDKEEIYMYDDACRNLPAELVIDNMNPFRVRIDKPKTNLVVDDLLEGKLNFSQDATDSFIIMNQDKTPTYDFACAVDDMLNDISFIVKGEDAINSTLKQEHIRTSLGYDKKIGYLHLHIIKDAPSVKSLLEEGFLVNSILNYLISMGNESAKGIFNIKDAIELFNFENISKTPALFNIQELKQINKKYLKDLDATELSRYVGFADANIGELAKVYLEDVSTTKELKPKIDAIFCKKEIPKEFEKEFKTITSCIKKAPYFQEFENFKNYVIKETSLDDKSVDDVLQLMVTGSKSGPKVTDIYKYIKNYIGEVIK